MSDFNYFGGSSLQTTNEVRRLQASTWKELVERFLNNPAHLPYTRKEFLAHPDRDRIKDCGFISPVTYPYEESGPRSIAKADRLVLAMLDMDDGPHVKDIFEDPKAIAEHLHPLNFALYTTAKHTPEKPRLRLAVPVDECDPSELPRIIRHIVGRIGIPVDFKGVAESCRPSQGFYRPVCFKGEDFSAVLATRTNGVNLDVGCLPAEVDDPDDFTSFGRTYHHTEQGDESLGLFFLPVQSVTSVDDVRDVFEHLDPDCSRIEWLGAAAALNHQFGYDPEQAEEAYNLFVEWSEKGTKFRGEGDTYKMWKSLKPYPEGRNPITLRSLFKRAQEAGWDGGEISKREKESVAGWIAVCEDPDELMRAGPAAIAALAVRNAVVEEMLVLALRKRLKELTGESVDKRVIYRDVARERKREKAKKAEERGADMPNWLRPICFISTSKVFHNFGTGVSLTPEAFDLTYGSLLMPPDPADAPPNGKPAVSPKDFALNLVKIPRVDEAFYCPLRGGEDPYFSVEGKTYLNTYNPLSTPSPDPEFAEEAEQKWWKLIGAITLDPAEQMYLTDYCTHLVQFPGVKIRWIPSIQSGEGVGKGVLGETMCVLLGPVNVSRINARVLRTPYSDHLIGAVLIIINEMHIPGHMREEVANALKDWITDDYFPVMQKYKDVKTRVPNYANGLVLTNYTDHIHIKPSDRRWFLVKSHMQTEAEIKELTDSGHFDEVSRLKDDPRLVAGLRYWMLKRKISPGFPVNGPAPRTKYREQLIRESKNALQDSVEFALGSGDPYFAEDIVSLVHLERSIPAEERRHAAKLSHYLTLLGFERWDGKKYPVVGGERTVIYVHRDKFCEFLGAPDEVLAERMEARGGLL